MLIEFIGCSGAGKTTLLKRVTAIFINKGFDAVSSTNMIKQRTFTGLVKSDSLRNLLLNFILLLRFIQSLKVHRHYFSLAIHTIHFYDHSIFGKLNRVRSLMRQMGEDLILRENSRDRLILVDEGMVGSAHNLLVYLDAYPELRIIRDFVRLVPLPDIIVHVDASVSLALERTVRRTDPPIRGASNSDLRALVEHGQKVFLQLSSFEKFAGRLLSVQNTYESVKKTDALAGQVVDFILQKFKDTSL